MKIDENASTAKSKPSIARRIAALGLGGVLLTRTVLADPSSIDLPGDRAFPENITSTQDGTLYVGSLDSSGIVRIKPGSAAQVWIKPGTFGLRSIFGVLADEQSNTLWVCSNEAAVASIEWPSRATRQKSKL